MIIFPFGIWSRYTDRLRECDCDMWGALKIPKSLKMLFRYGPYSLWAQRQDHIIGIRLTLFIWLLLQIISQCWCHLRMTKYEIIHGNSASIWGSRLTKNTELFWRLALRVIISWVVVIPASFTMFAIKSWLCETSKMRSIGCVVGHTSADGGFFFFYPILLQLRESNVCG